MLDIFLPYEEKTSEKDVENNMNGTCEKEGSFKEKWNKKDT